MRIASQKRQKYFYYKIADIRIFRIDNVKVLISQSRFGNKTCRFEKPES